MTVVAVQAATLVQQILNARSVDQRERRNREWAIEDRNTLAHTVKVTADTLANKVAADHQEVDEITRDHIATLTTKIDVVEELTRDVGLKAESAYQEANDVNKKIARLGLHLTGKNLLKPIEETKPIEGKAGEK